MYLVRGLCPKFSPHSSFCWTAVTSQCCHSRCFISLPYSSSSPYANLNRISNALSSASTTLNSPSTDASPLSGSYMKYVFGKKKPTQFVHSLWKHVIRKGDVVIDATCGNGHDPLALLRMVADKTVWRLCLCNGHTKSCFGRAQVGLFLMCHSKMEEVIPNGVAVSCVQLGEPPGGQKTVVTRSDTTLLALEAAKRILAPGGLITAVVYVGHPGGREEFDTVQAFASKLPVED